MNQLVFKPSRFAKKRPYLKTITGHSPEESPYPYEGPFNFRTYTHDIRRDHKFFSLPEGEGLYQVSNGTLEGKFYIAVNDDGNYTTLTRAELERALAGRFEFNPREGRVTYPDPENPFYSPELARWRSLEYFRFPTPMEEIEEFGETFRSGSFLKFDDDDFEWAD